MPNVSTSRWSKIRKKNKMFSLGNQAVVDLPAASNLSNFWNYGSFLGLLLALQILTGLILASHYHSGSSAAFPSVIHIMQDVNFGWLVRIFHLNGASFFFLGLYLHVGRGLYYGSFKLSKTWNVGVIIFFMSMMLAFLGYVLPWGQMSFWGATVITNFLSAFPIVGNFLVQWVWGGFSVSSPTLSRFFMLHFLAPFILLGLVGIHLIFLHESGSNNPLRVNSKYSLITFHWFFSSKDFFYFFIFFLIMGDFIFIAPFSLGDPENFILANPLVTPTHIVPEWYFLFAYGILRAIPNKLAGVLALVVSIGILFCAPIWPSKIKKKEKMFSIKKQLIFWSFIASFFLLTWLGGQVVEEPFISLSQMMVFFYFFFYFWFLA